MNWIADEGVLIDSMDTLSGWRKVGAGEVSLDIYNVRTSSASIKVDNLAAGNDTWLYKDANLDLSNLKTLSMWVFVHRTEALQSDIIRVAFSTTSDWSKYVEETWVYLRPGWNFLSTSIDKMDIYGGETLENPVIKIRLGVFSGTGSILIASIDEIRYNLKSIPICLLTFDDVRRTVYTNCFPIMQARGLKGTLYLTQNRLGASEYYVTYGQCSEMRDNGWLVANHTLTHADLQTLTDEQIIAEVGGMADWLIAQGWPEGAYHFAYPYGHGSPDTWPAMAQCHILSARMVSGGNWLSPAFYPFKMPANISLGKSYLDLAGAKAAIDHAIAYGEVCVFTIHGAQDPPDTEEFSVAEFTELMDYIVNSGLLVMRPDEFVDGELISEEDADTVVPNSYISSIDEADILAARRPNSASWSGDGKASALQEATRRIDALPLRGRKYDTGITAGIPDQALEFPRIIDGETLDWNSSTSTAFVPLAVQWACLEEAISILAAGECGRRQLQEEGVQSFSIGGKLSETFIAGAGTTGLQSAKARQYLRRYMGVAIR